MIFFCSLGEGSRVKDETKNWGRGEEARFQGIMKSTATKVISLNTFLSAFVCLIRCRNGHYPSSLTQNERFNSGFVGTTSMDGRIFGDKQFPDQPMIFSV